MVVLVESVTTPLWFTLAPPTVVQAPFVMSMVPRTSVLPVPVVDHASPHIGAGEAVVRPEETKNAAPATESVPVSVTST